MRSFLRRSAALLALTGAVTTTAIAATAPAASAGAYPSNCKNDYIRFGVVAGGHQSFEQQYSFNAGQFCLVSPSHNRIVTFQPDGNLVVYDVVGTNTAKWQSHTSSRGTRFNLQLDGNMVVYGPGYLGGPLTAWWNSKTSGAAGRGFMLKMQSDGNLVEYLLSSTSGAVIRPLWSTQTS